MTIFKNKDKKYAWQQKRFSFQHCCWLEFGFPIVTFKNPKIWTQRAKIRIRSRHNGRPISTRKESRNLHNTDTGKVAWIFSVNYGSPSIMLFRKFWPGRRNWSPRCRCTGQSKPGRTQSTQIFIDTIWRSFRAVT